MNLASVPLKRVIVTGALVGALSMSALATVSAQESTATPEAPAAEATAVQADPGFLGIRLADADAGVTVLLVLTDSPAAAAGLAEGDVITEVNGEAVADAQAVADAIGALSAGDAVALGVTRGMETLTIDATLGRAADFQTAIEGDGFGRGERNRFQLGDQSGFALRFGADDQAWGIVNLGEDSPLYAAGLRSGDLITAIDGSMYDPMQLLAYVAGLGADADLTLEVVRDGDTVEVTVPAADFVAGGIMAQFDMGENGMGGMFPGGQMPGMPFGELFERGGRGLNGYLGVTFETLDATVAADNNVTLTDGALVKDVEDGSPAATAGLQANDVITAVNGEPVDAERTLRDRLVAYETGDTVTLTVNRAGEELQLQATLGEPVMMGMGQMFQMPMMPGMMDPHGFGGGMGNGHGNGNGMGNGQMLPPGHPAVPGMPAPEATPETTGNPA